MFSPLKTLIIFTLFGVLCILVLKQNYIPFVFNYKKKKDLKIDYNEDMFRKELKTVYVDNRTGQRYFKINFYKWEVNKKEFLDLFFYRRMIIGDDIVTNIESYPTSDEFLFEFRIYHKFLDKLEARYILIENLETLKFETNYMQENSISYIENMIRDIEQGQLTKEKRRDLIIFLEKMTNLPANLATLIPAIIQIIKLW